MASPLVCPWRAVRPNTSLKNSPFSSSWALSVLSVDSSKANEMHLVFLTADFIWSNKSSASLSYCSGIREAYLIYFLYDVIFLSSLSCSVPASPDLAICIQLFSSLSCDTHPGVSWSPSTTFTLWIPLQGLAWWNSSVYAMCAQSIPTFVSLLPLLS